MGGDWGPLDGQFVMEWDYINVELGRSKTQVFSPKSKQIPLANQRFQAIDWGLPHPQGEGLGVAHIGTDLVKTIFRA